MTKGTSANALETTRDESPASTGLCLRATELLRFWGDQLLRAGGSVGANYREAQRARSNAEYCSKLGDSLREADESLYWMELLELEGFVTPRRLAPLKNEADQLIAIFVTLIRKRREGS